MITNPRCKISRPSPNRIVGNSGFSLFELVAFIISVAIIYAYAANRFGAFPAQAERANFTAILSTLQSGLNLELMFGMNGSGLQHPEALEGINPMDLMLSPPSNYLGAFSEIDPLELPRRSWYFDLDNEELVYLASNASGLYLKLNDRSVATDSLRFKVRAARRKTGSSTGLGATIVAAINPLDENSTEEQFGGVLIQPVFPFIWLPGEEDDLYSTALTASSR